MIQAAMRMNCRQKHGFLKTTVHLNDDRDFSDVLNVSKHCQAAAGAQSFNCPQSFHGLHAQIQVLKIWASYVYNNSEREGKCQ